MSKLRKLLNLTAIADECGKSHDAILKSIVRKSGSCLENLRFVIYETLDKAFREFEQEVKDKKKLKHPNIGNLNNKQ